MKILLIDDDAALVRAIARMLARSHDVETLSDPADALKCIRASQPDVIVCDVRLEGTSGIVVQANVQQDDPESARRFVFMSGHRDPRRSSSSNLSNDWLQKPFASSLLIESIVRIGARRIAGALPLNEVLVIEDEIDINDCLCQVLQHEGYVSRSATTLHAARSLLRISTPACMVLDLNLPDGTGEELLSELALTGSVPPCVLVSAARDAPRVAARFGIPLVRKPFDIDALLAVVANVIVPAPRVALGAHGGALGTRT